ncbi:hypothetical protein Gohar_018340, partial [Gossypium harknessii]|nr:hypothetical protein [Gossypium lobatum]MBA0677845.1 hypothetical protein [Gossypium aridum]MBA0793967.1 hypothetical protein [Gossypium harknessii]
MDATLARQFKYLLHHYLAITTNFNHLVRAKQSLIPWRFFTHHQAVNTLITSPLVGNATVMITFTTL